MKETVYAVEYRNMHTACHGLFLYKDLETACEVDDALEEIADSATPEEIEAVLQADKMYDDASAFEEIDYRDVDFDEEAGEYVYSMPFDDELVIVVVNTDHDVHDLYL